MEIVQDGDVSAVLYGVGFVAVIAMSAVVGVPALVEPRVSSPESRAISALKTISWSQGRFRERDADGNGTLDYAASLRELSEHGLISGVLGRGTRQGYSLWVTHNPMEPEFEWAATADPIHTCQGLRYFATNHEGVTFYTTSGPIPIDPRTCAIPPGPVPVGK